MRTNLILLLSLWTGIASAQLPALPMFVTSSAMTPMSSLVAVWTMDEDVLSGTRVDSVGGNNLTDVNSKVGSVRGWAAAGAAMFTNTTGVILRHADNATLGAGPGVSFTISFWAMGLHANSGGIGEWNQSSTVDYLYHFDSGILEVSDLSDTQQLLSPTVAPTGATTWHHVVFGFDNNTGLLFLQVDGGTRDTKSISGVRRSGQNFDVGSIPLAMVDELYLWKRALTSAEVVSLYNGGYGMAYPFNLDKGTQQAGVYAWACKHNSGTKPISATTNALITFINSSIADGTYGKCTNVFVFPPNESLINATTPLKAGFIVTPGNDTIAPLAGDPPVNHSFVDADISVNGIKGDGVGKYLELNSSISLGYANALFPTPSSSGFVIYAYTTGPTAGSAEFGQVNTSGSPVKGVFWYANSFGSSFGQVACIGDNGASMSTNSNINPGYFSVQRDSTTSIKEYFASSGTAHQVLLANTTSSTTALPGEKLGLMAWDFNNGFGAYATNTISHLSMQSSVFSASDSANYYNDVQTLRTTWGGGYR